MDAKAARGFSSGAFDSVSSLASADKDADIFLFAPGEDMLRSIGIIDDLGKDAGFFVYVDNLDVGDVKAGEEVGGSVDVDGPVSHRDGLLVDRQKKIKDE